MLASLSVAACVAPRPYCKPEMKEEGDIIMRESRHPCLEVCERDTEKKKKQRETKERNRCRQM